MSYGLVGLYALYLIFVGVNKNASGLVTNIEADAKGFAPWLIAVVALMALDDVEVLKPVVAPFMGLAILTFVLKNYGKLEQQLQQITGYPKQA